MDKDLYIDQKISLDPATITDSVVLETEFEENMPEENNSTDSSRETSSSNQKTDEPAKIHLFFDAIKEDNFEAVKMLVEKDKTLVEKTDQNGNTPFHVAASNCSNIDIIKYLLEQDSYVIARKNNANQLPLDLANTREKRKILRIAAWQNIGCSCGIIIGFIGFMVSGWIFRENSVFARSDWEDITKIVVVIVFIVFIIIFGAIGQGIGWIIGQLVVDEREKW
jgi:hypothetical protein